MRFSVSPVGALLALYLLASATASGQAAKAAPPPPGLSAVSELRLRGENRENSDFDRSGDSSPRDLLLRLRVGLRYTDRHGADLFLQPQFAWQDDTHWARATGTTRDLDIHQGYADVRAGQMKWRLGRQEVVFGDARLIGNGNWTNVGRSWDMARLSLQDRRTATDLFLGKLGQAPAKTREPLLGGVYATLTHRPALKQDLYLIYKSVSVTAATSQKVVTIGTRPVYRNGSLDATLEAAFQFGNTESRPTSAWAYAAAVGWTLPGRTGVRFAVERDFASGGNPVGAGGYHTFDQLYPTNHGHYGIIDYAGWRNMQNWRLSLQAKPFPRWQASLDGHFFALANARDFWYSDSGRPMTGANGQPLRDPTGAAGRDLGREFDVVLSYAATGGLNLSAGYARFLPGEFVRRANGGRADASDWFYLQAILGF